MPPDGVGRRAMERGQVLGPLAGGDHLQPAGARPVDLLGDQRRLVAIGQAVDDALRLRPPRQRARARVARRLDHELDLGAPQQHHRIVGQPGRPTAASIGGGTSGGALGGPADGGQVRPRPARVQIGDPDHLQPRRGRHLRQEHAGELAAADHADPQRPTLGLPPPQLAMEVHARSPSLSITGALATCCRTATSPNCHLSVPVLSRDVHSVPACSAVTLVTGRCWEPA